MHKNRYNSQFENDSVSGVKQIQYKQTGQRYTNTNESLSQNEQTQDSSVKIPIKQEQKGSQMKIDDDTMINLSAYEKETQITQTTQHIENFDKICIIENVQQKPNLKNIFNIPIYEREKSQLQIEEDCKNSLPNTERSTNKKLSQKLSSSSQKVIFIKNTRRSFNIFNDQKLMNQQILNDVKDKYNSSLKDIYDNKDLYDENQQSSQKIRGTLAFIDEKQPIEQSTSRSPSRYIEYQKQIKQQQKVNHTNQIQNQQIISSDNNQQDAINIKKHRYSQQCFPQSCEEIMMPKQNNSDKANHPFSNISTSVSTASPQQENDTNNTSKLATNDKSQKSTFIQNLLAKSRDQSRQGNTDQKQDRFIQKNPNYISIDSHLQDQKEQQIQQQQDRMFTKSDQTIHLISMNDQIQQNSIQTIIENQNQTEQQKLKLQNLQNSSVQQSENEIFETDRSKKKINQKKYLINDEDESSNFVNSIDNQLNQANIDANINQLQKQDSTKDHLFSNYFEKTCESKCKNEYLKCDEQIIEKDNLQQNRQTHSQSSIRKPFQSSRKKNYLQKFSTEVDDEIYTPTQFEYNNTNEIQIIQLSQDNQLESKFNSQKNKNNTEQQQQIENKSQFKQNQNLSQLISSNFKRIENELEIDLGVNKQNILQKDEGKSQTILNQFQKSNEKESTDNRLYKIQIQKCSQQDIQDPLINKLIDNREYKNPIQNGDYRKTTGFLQYEQLQSPQQVDDFNHFSKQQNAFDQFTKQEYDQQDVQVQNNNYFSMTKNNINNIDHEEYVPKFKQSLDKLSINKKSSNIIQFETDDEQEDIETQSIQNQKIEQNDNENKQNYQEKQKNIPELIDNQPQFKINTIQKQRRDQLFQAFSQNSTPQNSQKSVKQLRNSDPALSNNQDEMKVKNKPSNFILIKQQNSREDMERKESDEEKQNKQNYPQNNLSNQYCIQQNTVPIYLITPPTEENKKDQIINANVSEQRRESSKQNDENGNKQFYENCDTCSGEDLEDFDDEEDEDEYEFDLDDEGVENEGDIQILQSIIRQASNQKHEQQTNEKSQEMNQYQYQVKYNEREIGIGRYFCEKLFNVYGDNKIFSKKKRKLKKWCKMIQCAEDRFLLKSKETENENDINNQVRQLQKTVKQNMNQSVLHNLDNHSISYSQRIQALQSQLLDQYNNQVRKGSDEFQVKNSDEQSNKYSNDESSSAQEEFELIQEFLKLLKKGPPMWYRWPAWKVSIDLNVEEYRQLYFKLRLIGKSNSQQNHQTCTNPIDKQIDKDITRTFPNEPFFSDPAYVHQSTESLRCVLKAISLHYDKVGYCQGMNFFAAYLLLINGGDELQTFSMIVQMEKKFSIMSLFEEGFPLIQFMNFVFQREFGRKFSKLFKHFDQLKIPETMWVVQWFQTLFLNSLSLNVVCRFWDYIFYSGCILSSISISLSLIHEFSHHLIKMDMDEISKFTQKLKCCSVIKGEMRNSPCKPKPILSPLLNLLQKEQVLLDDNVIIDPEKIIKRAQTYEIPKKDILSYINEFKQVNFIYKDKPFLKKMEDLINQQFAENIPQQSNKSLNPFRKHSQVQPNFGKQTTPKKSTKIENKRETQSLLHPNSNETKSKNPFSIFGFLQKKNQEITPEKK